MGIFLVHDSQSSDIHGTDNTKRTGCGIKLTTAENLRRFTKGNECIDVKDITCMKCKEILVKRMIKESNKQEAKELKEEKKRNSKLKKEGIEIAEEIFEQAVSKRSPLDIITSFIPNIPGVKISENSADIPEHIASEEKFEEETNQESEEIAEVIYDEPEHSTEELEVDILEEIENVEEKPIEVDKFLIDMETIGLTPLEEVQSKVASEEQNSEIEEPEEIEETEEGEPLCEKYIPPTEIESEPEASSIAKDDDFLSQFIFNRPKEKQEHKPRRVDIPETKKAIDDDFAQFILPKSEVELLKEQEKVEPEVKEDISNHEVDDDFSKYILPSPTTDDTETVKKSAKISLPKNKVIDDSFAQFILNKTVRREKKEEKEQDVEIIPPPKKAIDDDFSQFILPNLNGNIMSAEETEITEEPVIEEEKEVEEVEETPVLEEIEVPTIEEISTPVIEETETLAIEEPVIEEEKEVEEVEETPVLEEIEIPTIEEISTPVIEETVAIEEPVIEEEKEVEEVEETPVLEEIEIPTIEEISTPVIEETVAIEEPVIEEEKEVEEVEETPVLEEIEIPTIEEISTPVIEETETVAIEEPVIEEEKEVEEVEETPVIEEISTPVIEEISTPVIEETVAIEEPVIEEEKEVEETEKEPVKSLTFDEVAENLFSTNSNTVEYTRADNHKYENIVIIGESASPQAENTIEGIVSIEDLIVDEPEREDIPEDKANEKSASKDSHKQPASVMSDSPKQEPKVEPIPQGASAQQIVCDENGNPIPMMYNQYGQPVPIIYNQFGQPMPVMYNQYGQPMQQIVATPSMQFTPVYPQNIPPTSQVIPSSMPQQPTMQPIQQQGLQQPQQQAGQQPPVISDINDALNKLENKAPSEPSISVFATEGVNKPQPVNSVFEQVLSGGDKSSGPIILDSIEDVLSAVTGKQIIEEEELMPEFQEYVAPVKTVEPIEPKKKEEKSTLTKAELKEQQRKEKLDKKFQEDLIKRGFDPSESQRSKRGR